MLYHSSQMTHVTLHDANCFHEIFGLPGNLALCSLNLVENPGSTSSNILLQILRSLSGQLRNLFTRLAHLSGSFLPSNESNSAATAVKASSAKKNLAIKDRSLLLGLYRNSLK